MNTKYKVLINPCAPLCRGCMFEKKRSCGKPKDITESCIVFTNSGEHMGIFVIDKEKS